MVYRGPTDLRSISSVRLKQPYHALVLRRPVALKSSASPDGRSRVCHKVVGVVVGQAVTAGKSFCWLWALRAGRRGGAVGKRCPNPLHTVLMVLGVIRGEAVTKVILAPPHLLLVQPLLGKKRGQHPDLQVAEQVSLCPSVSCPCPTLPPGLSPAGSETNTAHMQKPTPLYLAILISPTCSLSHLPSVWKRVSQQNTQN